jgi:16S rRNA (adenine1518-N6/adenine1519-N6)-dimethyltransferase
MDIRLYQGKFDSRYCHNLHLRGHNGHFGCHMTAIDELPPLRETIRRHRLSAKKSLGQNFLLDLNLTARIARAGGSVEGITVVEIGPGPGGLTRALLANGARHVIAIERDGRAIAALGEIAAHYPGRLTVVEADALKIDWNCAPIPSIVSPCPAPSAQSRHSGQRSKQPLACPPRPPGEGRQGESSPAQEAEPDRQPRTTIEWGEGLAATTMFPDDSMQHGAAANMTAARVIANLPYNIATALLVRWLGIEPWPPWYDSLVLMFQREVAERIVAAPGAKQYGRLAVLAGWRMEAKIMFDVAPSAFVPPPKVTSSVVRLVPRACPLPCSRAMLERVTAAAFGHRRKMLRQSLRALSADPQPILAAAGIDPAARAEEIPVDGFVALTNAASSYRSTLTSVE